MQDSPTCPPVLRVLDGPLQGCEFVLERPCTLFVVGPAAVICDESTPCAVPADAIYVPFEHSANFEVLVAANSRDGCTVRLLNHSEERFLAFQTVHVLDGLRIALRPEGQDWAPGVLQPASLAPAALASRGRASHWRGLAPGLAAVVLLACLAAVWYGLRDTSVSTVEKLVKGSTSPLQVVHGRDKSVYVFAGNERDLSWARQVLARNGHNAEHVTTPYMEAGRLQQLLAERMPQLAWYRLDFTDVQRPRIWVSGQRNSVNAVLRQNLEHLLHEATPYATAFSIEVGDDRAMARHAELALARLALPYERRDRTDSVTFSIQGGLQDTELAAVRALVSEFYRQWGDRYVHFSVELKDDWLKGKSFQYGPSGYIKMTPSSWYFPKPL